MKFMKYMILYNDRIIWLFSEIFGNGLKFQGVFGLEEKYMIEENIFVDNIFLEK